MKVIGLEEVSIGSIIWGWGLSFAVKRNCFSALLLAKISLGISNSVGANPSNVN